MSSLALRLSLALLLLASPRAVARDAGIEFFEAKIRPVLVKHCYACHSSDASAKKKLRGDLYVDTRAGLRKGGASGAAVAPGKPEASLLLKAIRYQDESMQMPPTGKLPAAVIADFEKWIATGAADPRDGAGVVAVDPAAAKKHWAFQPIRRPAVPIVQQADWARTVVDRFLLAKLEAKKLTPSAEADRRTLLRRVSFDLIGLPPTPAEMDAYLRDPSPDAYERVVDALLSSPAYGERWGRHWLDVARYADTKDGVLMYGDDRVRPFAYTYRDYVIEAFNDDRPYDRFVHEQLAADRLDAKDGRGMAALGFLTLGRMFDNNIHDILDDRIDTVTRGLVGLTVSCARCHDHKYDPIPTQDYYSLYGVFANSEVPLELPLLGASGESAFEKKVAGKRQELQKFLDAQYALLAETARQRVGDYLVHVVTTKPDPLETAIFFLSLAPTDLRPPMIAQWRRYIERRAVADDPVFGPWSELIKPDESKLPERLESLRAGWKERPAGVEKGQINPLVRDLLRKEKLGSRADVARAYGKLLSEVLIASKKADAPSDPAKRQLLAIVTGPDSPAFFPRSRTRDYMSRAEKDTFGGKMQELDRLAVQATDAPPRAMALVDSAQIVDPRVFMRGDPSRLGETVPRRFLHIVEGEKRSAFRDGSGRLDLAKSITSPSNPLTARVIVNRVWMHHFGEPLVESPSDFGLRTPPPSHPELLDWLASELQADGWSLKRLHRLLVLSSVYRQSSTDRAACRSVDPENRLLWRMNRRRLDFEAMRDGLLATSGRLDQRMSGRPVDVAGDAKNARRTVYGLVDRQSLPGVFRAFDFASPDQSAERRTRTTVPQQALFGLNSPFMLEQARALAARSDVASEPDAEKRVTALYRVALGRRPSAEEVSLATAFVDSPREGSKLDGWGQLAQVLLLTNEWVFVD